MRIQIMNTSKNSSYEVGDHLTVVREDTNYYYVKCKGSIEKVPKQDVVVI